MHRVYSEPGIYRGIHLIYLLFIFPFYHKGGFYEVANFIVKHFRFCISLVYGLGIMTTTMFWQLELVHISLRHQSRRIYSEPPTQSRQLFYLFSIYRYSELGKFKVSIIHPYSEVQKKYFYCSMIYSLVLSNALRTLIVYKHSVSYTLRESSNRSLFKFLFLDNYIQRCPFEILSMSFKTTFYRFPLLNCGIYLRSFM